MATLKCKISIIALLALFSGSAWSADSIDVGVYYFPGWSVDSALRPKDPWAPIRKYPSREPMLGWYKEGSVRVAEKQIEWMSDYGIDFVIYDWYWRNDAEKGIAFDGAINAFLKASNAGKLEFAILWANHTQTPLSTHQFDQIVEYWISNYFTKPNYKSVDGKPVVFIFSPAELRDQAKKCGTTAQVLLARARALARARGFKGIYFVGGAHAVASEVNGEMPKDSYDAISAYNYQFGLSGKLENRRLSRSYKELSAGYEETWKWILRNSSLPYFIPASSGWDRRPWGGSTDPAHDNSESVPIEFAEHLDTARKIVDQYPEQSKRTIVICCWNEFGEGSFVEPTKKYGFNYLNAIKTELK